MDDKSLIQLEQLNELKEKGILTEEEFNLQKQNLIQDFVLKNPEKIRSEYVWFLSLAPIFGQLFENLITKTIGSGENIYIISVAINVLLSWLDSKELKNAGFTGKFLDESWLIPTYLYERAKLLNEQPIYLWVWLVSFAAIIFA